jgi:hypothetical protein
MEFVKQNKMVKKETGSVSVSSIRESIDSIETLTRMYKSKRLSTESYIKLVNENLYKLTTRRNYLKYLKSIGQ